MFGGQFQFNVHKSDVRYANECVPFTHAFREKGSHQFISRLYTKEGTDGQKLKNIKTDCDLRF